MRRGWSPYQNNRRVTIWYIYDDNPVSKYTVLCMVLRFLMFFKFLKIRYKTTFSKTTKSIYVNIWSWKVPYKTLKIRISDH